MSSTATTTTIPNRSQEWQQSKTKHTAKQPSKKGTNPTRAKIPGTNAKTRLCNNFLRDGNCPFGNRCTYAHGEEEMLKQTPSKVKTPCWYFNHGGCTKSSDKCTYAHVIAPEMRKPVHLQHPCPYYHHITPLNCRRGEKCGGDHFYELSEDEWKHHFPEESFPGAGYFERKPEPPSKSEPPTRKEDKKQIVEDEFPILCTQQAKPKYVVGAWSTPLQVKEETVKEQPKQKPVKMYASKPPQRVSLMPTGRSWADCEDDDDENDDNDEQQTPAVDWWGDESSSESEKESEDYLYKDNSAPIVKKLNVPMPVTGLRGEVDSLRKQVDQLTIMLKKDPSKMPVMDGELKGLVTTALKQLLDTQ